MWTLAGFADEIDADFETQCAVLDKLGIRYMELRSAWATNVVDLDDTEIAEARRILDQHEIGVSSIGSPIGKINITEDFEKHLRRAERALHAARTLDAPFVRVFSFFFTAEQQAVEHRAEVLRRMRALTELAERAGVVLLHENEKEIYGDVPSRVLDIARSVSSPYLRLAWDAANYVQVGVTPYTEGYEALRPYTDYVQIKDALLATAEVVPPGEGNGQVRETVRALRADGFDGFFSMEPHLAESCAFGGYSGAEQFSRATKAFTTILDEEGIEYT